MHVREFVVFDRLVTQCMCVNLFCDKVTIVCMTIMCNADSVGVGVRCCAEHWHELVQEFVVASGLGLKCKLFVVGE